VPGRRLCRPLRAVAGLAEGFAESSSTLLDQPALVMHTIAGSFTLLVSRNLHVVNDLVLDNA